MDSQFSTLLPTVKDKLARRLTAVGSFVAILREQLSDSHARVCLRFFSIKCIPHREEVIGTLSMAENKIVDKPLIKLLAVAENNKMRHEACCK